MVRREWMWLPDGGGRVVPGLGEVPGVPVLYGEVTAVGVLPAVRIRPHGSEHPI